MQKQVCWKCGKIIPENDFVDQSRRFCEDCYEVHSDEYRAVKTEYAILKNQIMFERAMRFMEKACSDMTRLKPYALAVKKHSRDNPELYLSSHEMISAVVLLAEGYNIQMNASVGHFRVDILIPELHVCFEIDGDRHKFTPAQDGKRDTEIRAKLGGLWEVVRIPTKYIEEQPEKIPEAIKEMYAGIKKIRSENNGFLPEKYSKRHKAYYEQNTLQAIRKTHVI